MLGTQQQGTGFVPRLEFSGADPVAIGLLEIYGVPKGGTVTVDLEVTDSGVSISATARTADRTGVEMEALTAVSVAALALVDMVKAIDPAAVISDICVQEKTGGKTGPWRRPS